MYQEGVQALFGFCEPLWLPIFPVWDPDLSPLGSPCFQFLDYLIELSTCTTQWIQDYVYLILFQKYDKLFDMAYNFLIIWSDGVQHSGSKVMCLWYCILIWHTNHLIWHTTAESRTIHNLFEFRPQTAAHKLNKVHLLHSYDDDDLLQPMASLTFEFILTFSFQVLSIMTNPYEYLTSDNSDS